MSMPVFFDPTSHILSLWPDAQIERLAPNVVRVTFPDGEEATITAHDAGQPHVGEEPKRALADIAILKGQVEALTEHAKAVNARLTALEAAAERCPGGRRRQKREPEAAAHPADVTYATPDPVTGRRGPL